MSDSGGATQTPTAKRSATWAARLERLRSRSAFVDICLSLLRRDADLGGDMMSGALAFRFFLVALPLALVLVSAFGFAASRGLSWITTAGENLQLTATFTESVSHAASVAEQARWWTLTLGVFGLLWGSFSTSRTIRTIHRIVWDTSDPRQPHMLAGVLVFIAGLFVLIGGSAFSAWLRASGGPLVGVVAAAGFLVVAFGIWLGVSLFLPRRTSAWTDLVPGALVFAGGFEVLHVLTVYVIAWRLTRASALYGSLGTAFAMLGWLYFLGRVVVAAPVVNVVLWERRHPMATPKDPAAALAELARDIAD